MIKLLWFGFFELGFAIAGSPRDDYWRRSGRRTGRLWQWAPAVFGVQLLSFL
jgi:hypothetical protein